MVRSVFVATFKMHVVACAWLCALFIVGACGRMAPMPQAAPAPNDIPPWALWGSGAAMENNQAVFFGVGTVMGLRNVALARSVADNRARAEMSKAMSSALMRVLETPQEPLAPQGLEHGAQTVPGGKEAVSADQAFKLLSAAALMQVQIVEHAYSHSDGAVFSLARLDVNSWLDNLSHVRELTPVWQQRVVQNLFEVHRQLVMQKRAAALQNKILVKETKP